MALFGLGKKSQLRKLACRDMGMNCDAAFTGKTDEEVLRQAADHAQKVHSMKPTAEMAAQMKKLIKVA